LRRRIEVIPNPVPVAVRHARPNRPGFDGRFNLLAVGRLESVKCYNSLIRAFARIAADHPTWHLRMLGDGSKQEALQRIAVEVDIRERVHFEPWISDPSGAYAGSHLFAIPSLWEGFSNALAEAMSHGLPAVGFRDAAGVAQLIADGESGWLAEGLNDEAALARTLSMAMADGAERARRGACAAKGMAAYEPEALFDRWARLVEQLMG
jgi:GalNAc-alpha-(1->4)-GalNAc-alpha-(1->3)-diNAcBac-PP-undecaprenol alpha-1,4-N-acetyl-D-galactosaminyltransferase